MRICWKVTSHVCFLVKTRPAATQTFVYHIPAEQYSAALCWLCAVRIASVRVFIILLSFLGQSWVCLMSMHRIPFCKHAHLEDPATLPLCLLCHQLHTQIWNRQITVHSPFVTPPLIGQSKCSWSLIGPIIWTIKGIKIIFQRCCVLHNAHKSHNYPSLKAF